MKTLLTSTTALLLLLVCAPEAALAQTVAGATATDTLVISNDAQLSALASGLLPELAERSGLGLRGPVRIEKRSRAQLESFLIEKLDEELTPERERGLVGAYNLLGLVPSDFQLRGTLLAVYQEQVAGFYDPDTQALYVLDDQPRAALESLLLHELVHAVQDQWVSLDSVTAVELGNDRRTAAQAAIEGHATLVMLEYMMNAMQPGVGLDMVEVPDFRTLFGPALEGVQDQYPALSSAPRIIQEGLLLPYLEGASFVQAVWAKRGARDAPFEALLPASTEQVSSPERFLSTPPDSPTTVELSLTAGAALPEAGVELMTEVMGVAELRVMLEEIAGPESGVGANGWDGDRWLLVEQGESLGLVLAVVFDAVAPRDRFVDLLTHGLGAFPAAARLESVTVSGRPVALLRIGTDAAVTVTLAGGEDRAGAPVR